MEAEQRKQKGGERERQLLVVLWRDGRRSFSLSGSGDRHRREVTFAIGSRGPTFRVSNIWGPLAAVFFEVVVAIGWGFALSNLEGKFKGCGNTTSNVVRYRRNSWFGCCGWARERV